MLDLSGTSMAAAVAAGVVALELDANAPAPLTPNAVKGILEYTAIRLPNADYLTQGAGEINAAWRGDAGRRDQHRRAAEFVVAGLGVPGYTTIDGVQNPWSEIVIWDNAVLGGNLLYYKNIIWGTNIVWGTHSKLVRGRNIVWGSNIIWGTRVIVKNRNIVWGSTDDDNIIWGTNLVRSRRVIGQRAKANNILWGTSDDDNIIWGTMDEDNIIWGTSMTCDNIIWGTWDRRRQHHLGHDPERQHRRRHVVWRRQHHLGHG